VLGFCTDSCEDLINVPALYLPTQITDCTLGIIYYLNNSFIFLQVKMRRLGQTKDYML
jgi:hypothetical protein